MCAYVCAGEEACACPWHAPAPSAAFRTAVGCDAAHAQQPVSLTMHCSPCTAPVAAARLAADAGAEQDLDEDELLLARMDAGLYTLQQVGAVGQCAW